MSDIGLKRTLLRRARPTDLEPLSWLRALARPRCNEQTEPNDSAEFSPEKYEYVGPDAERWCARQRIAHRRQCKNHGTQGANQRNFNSSNTEKDKAANDQSADHHHEHCAIDCKAKERDR